VGLRHLARSVPAPDRLRLREGWYLAAGDQPAATDWRAIAEPVPVAAALGWCVSHPAPAPLDAQTWWYRCNFDLPSGWAGQALRLGLDGLATLAEVSLNGQTVLGSRNMFQRHELLLAADALRVQGNELLIRFDPLSVALAQRRARPRWRVPMLTQQQLRWWRTTLLGRTPGWSPELPAVGPWREVWLEPAEAALPTHLTWHSTLDGQGRGELQMDVVLPRAASQVTLRLERAGQVHVQALVQDGQQHWTGVCLLPEVAAWWPHTHGEPALYGLSLQWHSAVGQAHALALGQTGFRRVDLDQRDGGFGLVVNGVPLFARGACWTPLDPLRLQAPAAQYEAALTQVRAAGLNMLRISGSMVYEDEAFFDACDAQGVMVWQDLMFANMDYPGEDPQFQAEVAAEIASQLPRWAGRASLAVVCGNAEVSQQAAMWGAPRELWAPALFHQHLAGQVHEALPGVPYWPSSAWGGALPFQPDQGSSSYYGVGAYRRELADARRSGLRFATECLALAQIPTASGCARVRGLAGGQATPTHGPVWKAGVARDLGAGWDFEDVRDHYVQRLYGESVEALQRSQPERYLLLGQAAAVELITAAFSEWRRPGSSCQGALVWFLRDLRPGAGWGVLDEQGDPKAAFHALAGVCQPLHLGLTDEGLNGLAVHLVNDRPDAVRGVLTLRAYRHGELCVAQGEQAVTVPAHAGISLAVAELLDGFCDLSWAYRFGPAPADVLVAQLRDARGEVLAERVHFIDPPVDAGAGPVLRVRDVGLTAQAARGPDGGMALTVSSRAAARCVYVEAAGWRADRHFAHLGPGASATLLLQPVAGQRQASAVHVGAINAGASVFVTLVA
jgi:beta-mannosidase